MVTKILQPNEDSIELVCRVFAERGRYKDFYDRLKPDLIESVRRYMQYNGDPSIISPLDLLTYTGNEEEALQRKASLIGLYSPKKDKLPYLQLENLRKHNSLVVCPSCGEPGRPRTLDHYLPKDCFPELSIVLLNLTPMCDWCQGKKLTDYITGEGKKRYLHPYFDDVDRPLFSIAFGPPYVTPTLSLSINDDLPPELKLLVSSHLEGVGFLERFAEYFKTSFRNILRKAKECQQPGGPHFRSLIQQFLDMASHYSKNSWDAVIYRSILSDVNMINYLENDELPEFL
jgi:hypothetical protein